jgi:arginine decarboxylase
MATASSCCTSTSAARSPTSARQGGAQRGGAGLHRAGQARRGPRVPRRRRRPGRRLRRLADQLRIERELHAAGVRQRRRLPHPDVCDDAGVKHPTIISESGRAIVAYHSVLVFNVLGVSAVRRGEIPQRRCPTTSSSRSSTCSRRTRTSPPRNALESYHDAQQALDMAMNLFSGGYLPLEQRCPGREPVLGDLPQAQKLVEQLEYVPEELEGLDDAAVRHLLLQLLAVPVDARQLGDQAALPVMPIHRLNERRRATPCSATSPATPTARSTVHRPPRRQATLPLHTLNGEPYYLGRLPVGAYQEILGDLHNLFGDTHAVHVSLDAKGNVVLDA